MIVRNERVQYTSQVGTIIHYELGWITSLNRALKTDFKGVGISDETLRGAFVIVFEMNNIS